MAIEICGCYNCSSNDSHLQAVDKLTRYFEEPKLSLKKRKFNFGNISIGRTGRSILENYCKSDGIACFVAGRIYSYDDGNEKTLFFQEKASPPRFIIEKYRESGFEFLKFLEGEFVIVLIDGDNIYLINDKKGLSSLYIYKEKDNVIFSTSAEPIVLSNKKLKIDRDAISELIIYGFVTNGKTFLEGIENLPPSTIAKIDNGKISFTSYFKFKPENKKEITESDIKELHSLFQKAVKKRLHKNVCLELSGGWDTRFILANMLKIGFKPVAQTTGRETSEDVIISEILARKYKIAHVITQKEASDELLHALKFEFNKDLAKGNLKIVYNQLPVSVRIAALRYKSLHRIGGMFGGELVGRTIPDFRNPFGIDYKKEDEMLIKKTFRNCENNLRDRINLHNFCGKENPSKLLYLFIIQVGRTYFSAVEGGGWPRPTFFFKDRILPFLDTEFLLKLFSLDAGQKPYELYWRMYEKYKDFLEVPWTQGSKPFAKDTITFRKQPNRNRYLFASKKDKADFVYFLKNNAIMNDSKGQLKGKLRNLYFIHSWIKYNRHLDDVKNLFAK